MSQINLKLLLGPRRQRVNTLRAEIKAMTAIHPFPLITHHLFLDQRQSVTRACLNALSTAVAFGDINDSPICPMLTGFRLLGNTAHGHILDRAAKARPFMSLQVGQNYHRVSAENPTGYLCLIQGAVSDLSWDIDPLP